MAMEDDRGKEVAVIAHIQRFSLKEFRNSCIRVVRVEGRFSAALPETKRPA